VKEWGVWGSCSLSRELALLWQEPFGAARGWLGAAACGAAAGRAVGSSVQLCRLPELPAASVGECSYAGARLRCAQGSPKTRCS